MEQILLENEKTILSMDQLKMIVDDNVGIALGTKFKGCFSMV